MVVRRVVCCCFVWSMTYANWLLLFCCCLLLLLPGDETGACGGGRCVASHVGTKFVHCLPGGSNAMKRAQWDERERGGAAALVHVEYMNVPLIFERRLHSSTMLLKNKFFFTHSLPGCPLVIHFFKKLSLCHHATLKKLWCTFISLATFCVASIETDELSCWPLDCTPSCPIDTRVLPNRPQCRQQDRWEKTRINSF